MRAYLLRILGVSLLASLCDYFLPDGAMRKFTSPIISLFVSAAILLPPIALLKNAPSGEDFLPVIENTLSTESYAESVATEYKKKITAEIAARGAACTEILLNDDFTVSHITLTGNVPPSAMHYIITELEVSRHHVEIRKD